MAKIMFSFFTAKNYTLQDLQKSQKIFSKNFGEKKICLILQLQKPTMLL